MIIKNIARLCRERKRICLYDDQNGGCQWIGDGSAAYPLFGMPVIDERTVFAVLDIPEDKRDGYLVSYSAWPERLNSGDEDDTERVLSPSDCGLVFKDMKLMPARTGRGLWFYDPKYRNPLRDLENVELYERTASDGGLYLAAKTGLLLRAVIMPKLPEPEKLERELETLLAELRDTIERSGEETEEEE